MAQVSSPSESTDPAAEYAPDAAARRVYELGEQLGFAATGITDARSSEHVEHIRRWLSRGSHGEMGYLENNLHVRIDPDLLLKGACSIICVADRYFDASGEAGHHAEISRGRIARYAMGEDYHKIIKKRLHTLADELSKVFPEETFRTAVDTAPTLEREHASRAGLGWQAKNTMLIHPRLGSYLLLGQIVTTLKLTPSRDADWPGLTEPPVDHCGSCTRCIDACPTRCIDPAGYSLDASRCISYLTIEHRSLIDAEFHGRMGDWVAGCDVCQEVCPHNIKRKTDPGVPTSVGMTLPMPNPDYQPRTDWLAGPPLLELLGWTEDDRRSAFRGSALKRIKLDMMKRNALIAAGNILRQREAPPLRRRIAELAADPSESELVRATAGEVLRRLPL